MDTISHSVGNRGKNIKADVATVQRLLNKHIPNLSPYLPLHADGLSGPLTIGLIKAFQRRYVEVIKPDGRVDPRGATIVKLREPTESLARKAGNSSDKENSTIKSIWLDYSPLLLRVQQLQCNERKTNTLFQSNVAVEVCRVGLTDDDYNRCATKLGVEVAAVKAVAHVESRGAGFLTNGLPKILFEGHQFSRLTGSIFDKDYPTVSYKKWVKKYYLGGIEEYSRLNTAKALDRKAALKSASWGKFQIMGFNHRHCGFDSVVDFVLAMQHSEAKHLDAFIAYVESVGLAKHLRTKDWAKFARGYNGPAYAKNAYDVKMAQAYESFQ